MQDHDLPLHNTYYTQTTHCCTVSLHVLACCSAAAHFRLLNVLQVWGRCEALTAGLSSDLAEQLRLVLEPQLASKMAGEYRTGKRISMKRVIAYIASHFRKDKIWLRRTRPDKRKYQASPLTQFPQLPATLQPCTPR